MVVIAVLVFLAVTCTLAAGVLWLTPSRTEQRLAATHALPRDASWTQTVVRMAAPLARLSTPEGDWDTSPLRLRFINAGIRQPEARLLYYGAKTVLPLAMAGFAFVALRAAQPVWGLSMALYVLLAALVGVYLPNLVLGWLVRRRKREIFESFPDAADLMLVCMEAGLGLDSALTKVAEEVRRKSSALADELHLTNLEMRAGATREQALRNLALRTGLEEVRTFASMLTQADRFGASIGDSLRVFSDDLRYRRQVRAEELAAKVPTKMLFPLVVFIFPSIIMVIMGPAVIQVIRTIMPMLDGSR
ncbi:type II secretion system F family protein [Ramlibacter sp. PS4R-6]|uniref:type II secretion system F family protein n=1 Tax=Ramlibacter sp. PS4R-6 TaxID=3133438 RepID=UPI0030A82A42